MLLLRKCLTWFGAALGATDAHFGGLITDLQRTDADLDKRLTELEQRDASRREQVKTCLAGLHELRREFEALHVKAATGGQVAEEGPRKIGPCLQCGNGEPGGCDISRAIRMGPHSDFHVWCSECGAQSSDMQTKKEAIWRWERPARLLREARGKGET